MSPRYSSVRRFLPDTSLGLLAFLLLVLLIAGGASRADASGQVLVRGAAALMLVLAVLLVRPVEPLPRPLPYFMVAIVALPALQLLPLPPGLWQVLPGRALLAQAVEGSQPWRPLSIQPGATYNALASLLVPITVLALIIGTPQIDRPRIISVVLALVGIAALLGLLQVSGAVLDNPFINDTPGEIGGSFANRNHFALMLAQGCLLAPAWAMQDRRHAVWRIPFALGLTLIFLLLILAGGSRAGMLVGAIGTLGGVLLARKGIARALDRVPGWARIVLVLCSAGIIIAMVGASIAFDRAQSVDRVLAMEAGSDLRARALPTVIAMIHDYFPFGAGFGSFDTTYRMHEPFELLHSSYFNHAHNDFVEIVLDGGFPALLLLLAALVWWTVASIRVWRRPAIIPEVTQGRVGSAMLLLVFIASVFDYPARTPLMMAMIVLAAAWLAYGAKAEA